MEPLYTVGVGVGALFPLELEAYYQFGSCDHLPCAQAYSHFLEVQSKFSRYESRNLWQKAFLAVHVMSAQERCAIRSSVAEL